MFSKVDSLLYRCVLKFEIKFYTIKWLGGGGLKLGVHVFKIFQTFKSLSPAVATRLQRWKCVGGLHGQEAAA